MALNRRLSNYACPNDTLQVTCYTLLSTYIQCYGQSPQEQFGVKGHIRGSSKPNQPLDNFCAIGMTETEGQRARGIVVMVFSKVNISLLIPFKCQLLALVSMPFILLTALQV